MEKNSSKNFPQLLSKVGTYEQVGDYLKIIIIICDAHFETLLYIFKIYRTVMHSLTFGT